MWLAGLGAGRRSARLARARLGELEREAAGKAAGVEVVSYGVLAFLHRWEARALAPCPVTCGGGQVPLAVRCIRLDRGRPVPLPHSKCWPVPRPGPFEDCSPEPCPAR